MVASPFNLDLARDTHRDHEAFLRALHEQRKLMISFFSRGGQDHELRLVAPVDFGPLPNARDLTNRYHMFDFTGQDAPHPMALHAAQIFRMAITNERFDPGDFLSRYPRPPRWWVARDWFVGWEG
jgi:hypothetical protein